MPIHGYPGNIVTANPTAPTFDSASGVWTTEQALQNIANWPMPLQQISRSLRFNSADSAYLNRTPSVAGNRKTWTWSGWVKRGASGDGTGSNHYFLFSANDGGGGTQCDFYQNTIRFYFAGGTYLLQTTQVFRDYSAWYHIVVSVDTTQATSTNRVKLYVNGVQITSFSTAVYPTQNLDSAINGAFAHYIGKNISINYFNGYLTEINFIDGLALDPSYFGFTDPNGIWQPRAYKGAYGTNGFYLNFSDNSSTTNLGLDYSGNGNNWTPNLFSVTAGADNDSLVDTPTPYGTDTGAGGEVRGNYATLNPISSSAIPTLTNGNLDTPSNQDQKATSGTIGVSSGKWYWEVTVNNDSKPCPYLGVTNRSQENNPDSAPTLANNAGRSVVRLADNYLYKNYTATGGISTGATAQGTNGTVGIALDFDAGEIKYYKNNSLFHTDATIPTSGVTLFPYFGITFSGGGGWNSSAFNFGQRPFAYTAPSGFKALVTTNLPEPTIADGGDYFNTVLWTGNGTSSGRSITGVGFQPDFVWAKARSSAYYHYLVDSVRTPNYSLFSNTTDGEAYQYARGYVASLDSDGFTSASGSIDNINLNETGTTFVAWNWKANGSGVSNTDGTITSTVSANTDSGFSIVTYTGTAASATIGHGLGVKPAMIIVKKRTDAAPGGARGWAVWHQSLATDKVLQLNTTGAELTEANFFIEGNINSTVFGVGADYDTGWTDNYVAYCFAAIPGYSAFGSYTGNGSADGPFVYTGFRPAWVMHKRTDTGGANQDWRIWDTSRSPSNLARIILVPNQTYADINDAAVGIDILSNGFKIRNADANVNPSGGTFIFAAFAENPFKYSRAR